MSVPYADLSSLQFQVLSKISKIIKVDMHFELSKATLNLYFGARKSKFNSSVIRKNALNIPLTRLHVECTSVPLAPSAPGPMPCVPDVPDPDVPSLLPWTGAFLGLVSYRLITSYGQPVILSPPSPLLHLIRLSKDARSLHLDWLVLTITERIYVSLHVPICLQTDSGQVPENPHSEVLGHVTFHWRWTAFQRDSKNLLQLQIVPLLVKKKLG